MWKWGPESKGKLASFFAVSPNAGIEIHYMSNTLEFSSRRMTVTSFPSPHPPPSYIYLYRVAQPRVCLCLCAPPSNPTHCSLWLSSRSTLHGPLVLLILLRRTMMLPDHPSRSWKPGSLTSSRNQMITVLLKAVRR